MAVTGTNSENQRSRFLVEELEVGGSSVSAPTPGSAITDLVLGSTYGDDAADIEAAVNGILATLRANGLLSS